MHIMYGIASNNATFINHISLHVYEEWIPLDFSGVWQSSWLEMGSKKICYFMGLKYMLKLYLDIISHLTINIILRAYVII